MKSIFCKYKIMSVTLILLSFFSLSASTNAVSNVWLEYIEFRDIDRGTYNEYRYKMTEKYFELRQIFEVEKNIDKALLLELSNLASTWYDYLPDNLANKNLYTLLDTNIKRSLNNEKSESTFNKLVASLQNYIEDVEIPRMTWAIEATPSEGNAPLTTTLRANVVDPTGTKNSDFNYVWWVDRGWEKEILWRKTFINYTFTSEGNYSIFLWVNSSHKNSKGNTDVIPFYGKADIRVKEKVASVIIKVNSASLWNSEWLKFDTDEARYGLLFDASSSTPNSGTKFLETEWDFWNGVTRKYDGAPRVEKVPYTNDGTYNVKLKLKTNAWKEVERNFLIYINHPAASIDSNKDEWYIGDKFTFSSKSYKRWDDNINYSWEIIDITRDEVIHTKNSNLINYTFNEKGNYNVKLKITLPNGEEDVDTKIIYINSRVPTAQFTSIIPQSNQPSYVMLDGSKSFDPDISDDGKLRFSWIIDGKKVNLEKPNENGSVWYYRFNSIGEHSIALEVIDPDDMSDTKSGNIAIKSLLDVNFESVPTAIQRDGSINFIATSENAKFYEWDFWDGVKDYGSTKNIKHTYDKSGSFLVTLTVTDEENNENKVSRNVFVWKSDTPLAIFDMKINGSEPLEYNPEACDGRWAFVTDKISSIKFDGKKSIDLDGQNTGLSYSWKLWNNKYETLPTPTYKFDELGCFPVKLTVVSGQNGASDASEQFVEVRNILPTLSSLTISSADDDTDPIVFNIKAIWAKDLDGVIQSYLWYYYTDYDTEAQGFKTTPTPETSFVLPKITGTYFFWVVLKDNNEEKFVSEDIGKFFRTVSSDNSNTPLIELKINDNSVSIWDEVVFEASVKNIIGKDLSGSSEYYWDFDGDGFFDKKWSTPTISHKYKKSGTFYPKLKVKYRGLSNVRNLTVDVTNKLKADFEYISVGNKFIFLDKSTGKIDTAVWDFWDGEVSNVVGDVVHSFKGTDRSHTVKLTIQEGTKEETVEKEIVANMKNILKARKSGVNLFSSPIIDEEHVMKVDEEDTRVILYPWESLGEWDEEVVYYAVDFDIETDSDLNGGKDDDIDNKNSASYRNGTPLTLVLNDNKKQTVRVFTLDAEEKLLDSYDFVIEKPYIVEEEINLDDIVFDGITESEREKIEKLKRLLEWLPTDDRLPAMKFVQRLQEEWFDARGKTDVIVEMQLYLNQVTDYDPTEVNELLESFLVEDNADKWERVVAFNALQNLIPTTVTCDDTWEFESCNALLIAKLETIRESNNIEENKKIGSEILDIIWLQSKDLMSDESKLRFKEVLKTFVYGGVNNIPESEREEIDDQPSGNEKSFSLLKWVLYITGWLLGLVFLLLILFFVFYKLTNKDKNVEFQDFIIEKTSWKSWGKEIDDILWNVEPIQDDALANIDFWDSPKVKKTENSVSQKTENTKKEAVSANIEKKVEKDLVDPLNDAKADKVPSWLWDSKKNTENSAQAVKAENIKKAETKKVDPARNDTEAEIPAWLQGVKMKQDEKDTVKKVEQTDQSKDKVTQENTKAVTPSSSPKEENKKAESLSKTNTIETPEKWIPDWLKWSLDGEKSEAKKLDSDQNKQKLQEKKIENDTTKVEKKSSQDTKITPEKIVEKPEGKKKIEQTSKIDQETKVLKKQKTKNKTSEEKLDEITKLDDGIPDWLKQVPVAQKKDPQKEVTKESTKPKETGDTKKVEKKNDASMASSTESKKINTDSEIKTPKVVHKEANTSSPAKSKDETIVKKSKDLGTKKDTSSGQKLWEWALWDDGMEVPDWLKWTDDTK